MKKTTDAAPALHLIRAFALVSFLAGLQGLSPAQDTGPAAIARVVDASIREEEGVSGRFLYRLLVEFRGKRPEKAAKLDIEEAPGIGVESVLAKPYRSAGSEFLIAFTAPSGGGWSFPGLRLSWDADILLVPPLKGPAGPDSPGRPGGGGAAEAPGPAASAPAWKSAKPPAQAASALALGDFSVTASLDRARVEVGEIAYLEFLLAGTGDFARAKAPRLKLLSGGVSLGEPRRYPGYDPASGEGRLLFRFPLRAFAPGIAKIRVEAYPVYDPEGERLIPGKESLLELRAAEPFPEGKKALAATKAATRRLPRLFWNVSMLAAFALALCLGAAGILLLARARSGRGASPKPGLLALGAAGCFLLLGAASALVMFFGAGPEPSLVLGPGQRIYVVPSDKARSWTEEGAEARILGKSEAADGSTWFRIVLEDSSTGWIRAEGAKGAEPP